MVFKIWNMKKNNDGKLIKKSQQYYGNNEYKYKYENRFL